MIDVLVGPDRRKPQQPVYGRMYQTPFADRIRNEVGIATIAVGAIFEADHVNSIIAAGRADLCALARPHLADPSGRCTRRPQLGYRDMRVAAAVPAGQDQLERNLERAAQLAGQTRGQWLSSLEGRHAVVTGGGRGIGAAIAEALAGAGARLTVMGRSRDALEAEAEKLRRNAPAQARRGRRGRAHVGAARLRARRAANSVRQRSWSTTPARRRARRSRRPTWRCGSGCST